MWQFILNILPKNQLKGKNIKGMSQMDSSNNYLKQIFQNYKFHKEFAKDMQVGLWHVMAQCLHSGGIFWICLITMKNFCFVTSSV